MQPREIALLQQMGLGYWQIRHPDLFPNYQPETITLPESCRLLLVFNGQWQTEDVALLKRILQSFALTLEDTLCLPTTSLDRLGEHHLAWCWFVDCQGSAPVGVNILRSTSLQKLQQHPELKKDLWRQICAYD